MKNKKVSIVIPCYNAESAISRCLDSILSQTYRNIEIICVDDHSKDNTLSTINRYKKLDERVTVISNKKNLGVSSSRNIGVRKSSGDFITFVDADDYVDDKTIEILINTVNDFGVDFVRYNYTKVGGADHHSNELYELANKVVSINKDFNKLASHFFTENKSIPTYSPLLLIRRSLFDKIYFREELEYLEDAAFYLDLLKVAEKCYFLDEKLYYYCDNKHSATHSTMNLASKVNNIKQVLKMVKTTPQISGRVSMLAAKNYGKAILRVKLSSVMKTPLKNSITAFVANGLAILIGFIAQRIFAQTLGAEYLGLNGLFSNIISMLSIAELGIGSAIIYNLYAPIKQNDRKTIKSLMLFYKKAYRYIALAITVVGIAILPFLHLFVTDLTIPVDIYLVFGLFIADSAISYLLSYRRSILYANQQNYLISLTHIAYLVALNGAQVAILLLTKNYYLYLMVKIFAHILENYILHRIATKKYPYLSESAESLPKKIKTDILIKIKALFYHKIGSFVVLGTDNLVISYFLGVVTVGLYSNYYMITNALDTVFGQAITALIPTVGHILVDKNQSKNYDSFKRVRRVSFAIALFASLGFLTLATPFITLWLGTDYLLPSIVLALLAINLFQKIMRYPYVTFKEAAGIYHEDRFVPLVESAINIVASVILVQLIGLPGVFIGTILSSLALWCYSYPKFVYKTLFGRRYREYILETAIYFAIFAAIITPIYLIFIA